MRSGKGRLLGLLLSGLVGFVVGLIQFGGISWPTTSGPIETQPTWIASPTLVAANDASGAYLLDNSPAESEPATGSYAPDFDLVTFDGEPVSLADYRGERVLVNFWASWCVPCRQEAPALQGAFEEHEDFVTLGVNVLDRESDALAFAEEFGLSFPLPVDEGERVMQTYRVRALPSSFLVDSEGIIRFVHIGPLNEETIADYLSQIP
jgi:peroxiredoxin